MAQNTKKTMNKTGAKNKTTGKTTAKSCKNCK